jgi:hypothetical protein
MGQQSPKALSQKPALRRLFQVRVLAASDCGIWMKRSKENPAAVFTVRKAGRDIASVGFVG